MQLYGGRDRATSRDHAVDVVRCGRGRDRLRADFRDFVTRCERLRRDRRPGAIPLDAQLLEPSEVHVGCPSDGPRVCRGRARLVLGDGRSARKRFRIRRGFTKLLEVGGVSRGVFSTAG
jgi:hypothetical protein